MASAVVNVELFSVKLFEKMKFDKNLICGNENSDTALHAVLQENYKIDWIIEALGDNFLSR